MVAMFTTSQEEEPTTLLYDHILVIARASLGEIQLCSYASY